MRRPQTAPPSRAEARSEHAARNVPFYLLIAGAYAVLTIPRMAQAGMFLDGVTYAAIARNLATGLGTFWSPHYTATLYPEFLEHPPLGFALQAAAFAVFGDHLAVERAYSFSAGLITAVAIVLIWRTAIDREHDWLPLVFWLLPSTVTWSIVNNMLEATQTAFTTMAVLLFVLSFGSARAGMLWSIGSALCVCAAVLTKGPTGFFPLAAPVVAAVTLGHPLRALVRGTVAAAAIAAVFAGIFAFDDPRAALETYWVQQVAASVSGARGGGRWRDLFRHLNGIVMRMGVLVIVAAIVGRRRRGDGTEYGHVRGWTWFFVALALAASIPIAASGRVMGHYLVPAIPIYALAFAALALPLIRPSLQEWRQRPLVTRAVGGFGVFLLALAAAAPVFGITMERRDRSRINAYHSLSPSIERGATFSTCEAAREDWTDHAYMQRFFRVSLDADHPTTHRYFFQIADRGCGPPPACRSVSAAGPFVLFDCETAGSD